MKTFGLFCTVLTLVLRVSSTYLCSKDSPPFSSELTNCTKEDFKPLCDGIVKCQDNDSNSQILVARYINQSGAESFCEFPRYLEGSNFVKCDFEILNSQFFVCEENRTVFNKRINFCDQNSCNDCPGRNEFAAGPGFKCPNLGRTCLVPQRLLYDNVPDCLGGQDMCFSLENQKLIHHNESLRYILEPEKSCFRCRDGSMLIAEQSVCDGIIDCSDLSDECLRCENPPEICKALVKSTESKCPIGQVECGDGYCVKRNQVCDGTVQCPNLIDEESEYCGVTLPCVDTQETQDCQCDQSCTATIGRACNITDIDCFTSLPKKDFNKNYTCPPSDMQSPSSCEPNDQEELGAICNGIVECKPSFSDELNCDRFVCKQPGNVTYSILHSSVCDFSADCEDGSDELNCDNRFYCHSNDVGAPYVRLHQVKNGRIDCADASDECVENNSTNYFAFHSSSQLLGSRLLYSLVWLMALVAITGNSIVIIQQVKILLKIRFQTKELSSMRANHILVLSLAIADFLMGIYLSAVGIAYEQLKGSYCAKELTWRSSGPCTWMGVTVLVSSEASVLTMVVLTSLRVYAIVKPFRTSSRPPAWLVFVLALGAWLLAIFIAILPLTDIFRAYFPDKALLPDNPFLNEKTVSFEEGKEFLISSLVFYPHKNEMVLKNVLNQAREAKTWDDIVAIANYLPLQHSDLYVAGRFGYYNIHSICIANFFATSNDPYVGLSLFLTVFNLCAFIYIATAYVTIYMLSFKNTATTADSSEATRMQRKIFRLIITDFFSWIPICIFAFIRFWDTEEKIISGNVYAVAAVILLPINSALNPLLYSNAIPTLLLKASNFFSLSNNSAKHTSSPVKTLATRSTADIL